MIRHAVSAALLCIAILLSGCNRDGNKPQAGRLEADGMAPDFVLTDLAGRQLKLSDFRGKVVLLEFWATWCPPCRASVPGLIAMQQKYGDRPFIVLGVSVDEGADAAVKVREFSADQHINYPLLIDTKGVARTFNVHGIPAGFLIDKNGKVIKSYSGYIENLDDALANEIGRLL